jgi:hypothetical protein
MHTKDQQFIVNAPLARPGEPVLDSKRLAMDRRRYRSEPFEPLA